MEIPAWGALLALVISIVLIMRNFPAVYALIIGAFIGGAISTFDIVGTVAQMTNGTKDISPAVLRVLTAGILAGVLIKTNSAKRIATSIAEKLGEKNLLVSLVLATFVLTASGVFIDIAVLTVAPIALAISNKSKLSKTAMLIALVGGGKSGNVISPNPNTISAAANFNAPLSEVMYSNIFAALAGIAITIVVLKIFSFKSETAESADLVDTPADMPPLWAALTGPIVAISLLLLRPICSIAIDPMIALPAGGFACSILTGNIKNFVADSKFGLEKMMSCCVLLLGTGCLAGIIKISTLKDVLLHTMTQLGVSDIFIAPVSAALMSAASASTVAGATIASASFSGAILASGVSAVWGAAMCNAGAVVFDQMPHGSFFHVSAGSVNADFKTRVKCVPYESLIGGAIAAASTMSCYIFMRFIS